MIYALVLAATLLENVIAVTNAAAQIDAAIVAKGGTTAGGLTNAPAAIAALPTGGGSGWVKPADWPDIKAIIEADERIGTTYPNSLIVLVKGSPFVGIKIRNACAYRFSDDPTTVVTPVSTGNYVEHDWTDVTPCHWVVMYGNSETVAHNTVQCKYADGSFGGSDQNSGGKLWVVAKGEASWRAWNDDACQKIDIQTSVANMYGGGGGYLQGYAMLVEFTSPLFRPTGTEAKNLFSSCYALQKVPEVIDLSQCTTAAGMFTSCYSLQKVPEVLDLSQCTTAASMFCNCYSLQKVPEVLALSQCTTAEIMFYNCFALKNVPTNLTLNAGLSISFAQSPLIDPATIATFDEDGNINGGMAYNLNTNTGSTGTITFHSYVKKGFTTDQKTKVSNLITSKGWQLSW